MALNFKKWLLTKLGGGQEQVTSMEIEGCDFFDIMDDIYLRELAFWTCVNKIANALSKCEFKTYMGNKTVKKSEYYLWNIEPNRNQNSSAFLTKLIGNLYRKNEALVIESNGQLLVADSFGKDRYALYDYIFKDVEVDEYAFSRTFTQSEVLYFQLNSVNMKGLIDGIYQSYKDLITYASKTYQKSRGNRGILNIDAYVIKSLYNW